MGWPADYSLRKLCSFVFLFAILRVDDNLLSKVYTFITLICCDYNFTDRHTPFTRYNRLFNRLLNGLDNRLHRVNKHSKGCPTGCSTGLTTGCIVQTGYHSAMHVSQIAKMTKEKYYKMCGCRCPETITLFNKACGI